MNRVRTRGIGIAVLLATLPSLLLLAAPARAQLEKKLSALDQAFQELYDGDPVTLEECIEVARVGSASLGVYEENLGVAESDRSAAKANWLPDLRLNASWQRSQRTDFDVQDPSVGSLVAGSPVILVDANGNLLQQLEINGTPAYQPAFLSTATMDEKVLQTFMSAQLSSNWTVFDGLARSQRIKATGASVRASEADLGYQESVLVQDVSEAFYNVLRAQAQVDVAMETEDVARQELERSRTYFDVGIATKSDVLQQQVNHSQAQLETIRARNSERQAFVLLTHLMNIPGARRFELAFALPTEVGDLSVPTLDSLLVEARGQRLDLVNSRESLQAANHYLKVARSGYWPQLQIFANASLNESKTPYRFGAQQNRAYAWGAQMSWNLFDRFQTRNASRRALADRRRAEYSLRQNELTMESELSAFLNTLTEAAESYTLAKETVAQAEEDLRLATERFKVGAGTSLDVINAQRSLGQARGDVVNAVADFYIAQAKIDRAVGR